MSDVTRYVRQLKQQHPITASFRHPSTPPMIAVANLHKYYGKAHVLRGINFRVQPGQICVVMGPSGCGKSTLLRCIIGATPIDRGEIRLDGENIAGLTEPEMDRVRRKFGVLFQSAALFGSLSVADNIALPIRQHTDLPASTIDLMVRMKLDLVGLGHAADLRPTQLSGGMKKRVGLARAIALDPSIVFYDEPSAGLDPIVVGQVDKLIVDLTRKLNITSVVITHEMRSAFRIADWMVLVHDGEVVAQGKPHEMRASDHPKVRQFIEGNAQGPITGAHSDQPSTFRDDVMRLRPAGQ